MASKPHTQKDRFDKLQKYNEFRAQHLHNLRFVKFCFKNLLLSFCQMITSRIRLIYDHLNLSKNNDRLNCDQIGAIISTNLL